jgi:nucleotide-binding universal stress UspA family protein
LKSAEDLVRCASAPFRSAGIQVRTLALTGDPKAVVVDYAGQIGVDLVVAGSHEASWMSFQDIERLNHAQHLYVRIGWPGPFRHLHDCGVTDLQGIH